MVSWVRLGPTPTRYVMNSLEISKVDLLATRCLCWRPTNSITALMAIYH